jgi:hypothetical protein
MLDEPELLIEIWRRHYNDPNFPEPVKLTKETFVIFTLTSLFLEGLILTG